jgi:hypothetical protein
MRFLPWIRPLRPGRGEASESTFLVPKTYFLARSKRASLKSEIATRQEAIKSKYAAKLPDELLRVLSTVEKRATE